MPHVGGLAIELELVCLGGHHGYRDCLLKPRVATLVLKALRREHFLQKLHGSACKFVRGFNGRDHPEPRSRCHRQALSTNLQQRGELELPSPRVASATLATLRVHYLGHVVLDDGFQGTVSLLPSSAYLAISPATVELAGPSALVKIPVSLST